MSSLSDDFDQLLSCPICYEPYTSTGDTVPYLLSCPCPHTVCLADIRRLASTSLSDASASSSSRHVSIRCPVCRHNTILPSISTITNTLKRNITLLSTIDIYNRHITQIQSQSQSHQQTQSQSQSQFSSSRQRTPQQQQQQQKHEQHVQRSCPLSSPSRSTTPSRRAQHSHEYITTPPRSSRNRTQPQLASPPSQRHHHQQLVADVDDNDNDIDSLNFASLAISSQSTSSPSHVTRNSRITFGKYRKHIFSTIPIDYITWLSRQTSSDASFMIWVSLACDEMMNVINFGKYKGHDIETIPTHYLEWMISQQDVATGELASFIPAAQAELEHTQQQQ